MKLVSTVAIDHNALDCEYATIDLNPDLSRLALRRVSTLKAQKNADPQLDEMYFWDNHVEYFSPWNDEEGARADSLSEMLGELPAEADDLRRAPDDFAVPESLLAHVECRQMIVREDAIAFIAIPKHASCYIRTAEIPLPLIEAAAASKWPLPTSAQSNGL